MSIPFTPEGFYGVFSAYNLALWPAQVFLLGLGVIGRPCGRIAALLLACVARHTALRAPCTASRQRTQKRYIGYFRLP